MRNLAETGTIREKLKELAISAEQRLHRLEQEATEEVKSLNSKIQELDQQLERYGGLVGNVNRKALAWRESL